MGTGMKDVIAQGIRAQVQSGRLRPGDRVPTVVQLAERYGVARQTVQEALSMLRTEGLIITMRGRPAVIAPVLPLRVVRSDRYNRRNREALDGSTTFEREVAESGWKGHIEYIHVGWVPCPERAATLLDIEPDEMVVERRRLRRACPLNEAGEPDTVLDRVVELFDSFIPRWVAEAAPDVLTFGSPGVGGSYSSIERQGGIEIETPWHRSLRWRSTTDEECARMGITRPVSVVVEDRVVYTTGRRPVTTDRCVTLSDLIVFEDDLVYDA